MVKKEFVNAVAEKTGLTKIDATAAIDAVAEVIMEVMANEDSVKFGNVCTFSGVTREARKARNPLTGETIDVAEKHGYPKCKFSANAKACD